LTGVFRENVWRAGVVRKRFEEWHGINTHVAAEHGARRPTIIALGGDHTPAQDVHRQLVSLYGATQMLNAALACLSFNTGGRALSQSMTSLRSQPMESSLPISRGRGNEAGMQAQ
jgi:hypothetical protein